MESIFAYEHPFVCTDGVIFTIKTQAADNYRKLPQGELDVLVYWREQEPFAGTWSLPGGFLNIDETPEENIRRKLLEKTPVEACWLEQLYTFSNVDRDPRARVISICYLGLMREAEAQKYHPEANWLKVKPQGSPEAGAVFLDNHGVVLRPENFAFDHYQMIITALERLQAKIQYSDSIFHLLPEYFTWAQLQNIYETILGHKELAANFRRKQQPFVMETNRTTKDKGHRPAKLLRRKIERSSQL